MSSSVDFADPVVARNVFIAQASEKVKEYERLHQRDVSLGRRPPIRLRGLLPGRNRPCPCASGKKWKHCCRKARPYVPDQADEKEPE